MIFVERKIARTLSSTVGASERNSR